MLRILCPIRSWQTARRGCLKSLKTGGEIRFEKGGPVPICQHRETFGFSLRLCLFRAGGYFVAKEKVEPMCGRYTLTKLDGFSLFFEIDENPGLTARYNIGPTQDVVVVRQTQPGRRRLAWMMWGLQPSWNSPGSGRGWINARSESVHRKPAFRDAFLRRRCLIPADGFYEWKQEARLRRPFHFRLKDSSLFAFAGIWDVGRVAGEVMENCAILTHSVQFADSTGSRSHAGDSAQGQLATLAATANRNRLADTTVGSLSR